jgi:anti-anti-sigma factor
MSISTAPSPDGKTLTIRISDRFDFTAHTALRAAYANAQPRFQSYVLDLRETNYMDSSALGMLLQLKEHAGGAKSAVHIKNAKPAIKEILSVANFQQLMTID